MNIIVISKNKIFAAVLSRFDLAVTLIWHYNDLGVTTLWNTTPFQHVYLGWALSDAINVYGPLVKIQHLVIWTISSMSDSIDTRINDTRDCDLPSSMHCTYSDGPDKANISDAIMFKGELVGKEMPAYRPPGQLWIFYELESPVFMRERVHVDWNKIRYIFNYTITYSTKSDITLPYGEWGSVDTKLESKLISKRKQNSLHGLSVTAQNIAK